MAIKINKYISLLLLSISFISFIGFGYYENLPDHFLSSSSDNTHNYLLYLLSSCISSCVYYLGPWVIVPALVYSTILFFKQFKVNYFSNLFLQPLVWIFFSISTYLFIPSFIGYSILTFLSLFDPYYLYFVFILVFFCILWFVDKENFVFAYFSSKIIIPCFFRFKGFANNISYRFRVSFNSVNEDNLNGTISSSSVTLFGPNNSSPVYNSLSSFDKDSKSLSNSATHDVGIDNINIGKKTTESGLKKIINKKINRVRPPTNCFKDYFENVNLKPGKRPSVVASLPGNDYFQKIIDRIEEKLLEFKIDGKIINILKGPVVDTFELELGSGVKVSKVTSSAEDLSLALYGAPIRIVYPMKGRTTVGIEVPRNPREVIYLDELLNTREFKNTSDRLPLAMGKDAFGLPFIVDLVGMPHMLVAGATGAGKSVFINTILVSLLVKKTPEEMKLILIDPKQLELALYSTLPHLIMPVVTDAKRASLSLLWAVDEMERRYSILKEVGVRNIDGYNDKLTNEPQIAGKIQHFFKDDERSYRLPYIVVIVDEFADLILTKAGKEIENNICRLAAKARAAGIHLIIATQRPSVDVITGLIKSNFPTRVSFRVTTSIDSRTILNSVGAERLLGKGDMLYKHGVDTIRVHSSFVDEVEIEKLTYSLAQFETGFDEEVIEFLENGGEKEKDPYSFGSHLPTLKEDAGDELFDQAVEIVTECRSASASMLQRRLKVGYNRAANLVELMEEKGIVGPAQGSKPRKVLIASK